MLNISASNLRFWEREFKQLSPRRNDKGTRFYTDVDIATIKQIMYLVNDQNLTLEGARQKLTHKKDAVSKQQELKERLLKVREELKAISKSFNQ